MEVLKCVCNVVSTERNPCQRHEAKCEEGLEEFPDWDVRNGFDFRPRVFLFESSSQNRWNVKGRVKDSPEKECPVCAVPQSAD